MNITYTLAVEQDDTPVRGNAIASGDAAVDREYEDEIIARLYAGDVWAWAAVRVTASVEGTDVVGTAYLGGCSYTDADAFRADAYFTDLCADARADLLDRLADAAAIYAAIERGES